MSLIIDVSYDTIAQWLIQRNHLHSSWTLHLKAIHKRLNSVIPLINSITRLRNDIEINSIIDELNHEQTYERYELCHRLFERCENIESLWNTLNSLSLTNLLGQYKSPVLHSLYHIRRAYVNTNLHLAEAGLCMLQYVKYDIVSLRVNVINMNKRISELRRRSCEYEKLAHSAFHKYRETAESLGITLNSKQSVEQQLKRQTTDLPEMLQAILQHLQAGPISRAIDYYCKFIQITVKASSICCESAVNESDNVLSLLRKLISQNSATHSHELEALQNEVNKVDDIVTVVDDDNVYTVDWSERSYDDEDISTGQQVKTDECISDDEQHWNIECVDSNECSLNSLQDIERVDGNQDNSLSETSNIVDSDIENKVSLLNSRNRVCFHRDISELLSFLQCRQQQLSLDVTGIVSSDLASLTDDNVDFVKCSIEHCESVLTRLGDDRLTRRLRIRESNTFLDRIVRQLDVQSTLSQTFEHKRLILDEREADTMVSLKETQQQLTTKINQTCRLKEMAETALSSLIGGERTVNLSGEIGATLRSAH